MFGARGLLCVTEAEQVVSWRECALLLRQHRERGLARLLQRVCCGPVFIRACMSCTPAYFAYVCACTVLVGVILSAWMLHSSALSQTPCAVQLWVHDKQHRAVRSSTGAA